MTELNRFIFAEDAIALPKGAWARTERRTLRRGEKPVLSLTQGRQRAYVFPLYTPQGFAVTSECPADHPHHNSFWVAADHVYCQMPAADDRIEEYTYNFYVDETFHGRAPGRIVETGVVSDSIGPNSIRLVQSLEWRGPIEWAAPKGRIAARETRTLDITLDGGIYVIDVTSVLEAGEWDFTVGPTRHSYFNVRVAEALSVTCGGTVRDDQDRLGGDAITGSDARWIDYSGHAGGGHTAGVAVCPDPRDHADLTWFVTDWGVVTVGPFRKEKRMVRRGEPMRLRYRTLIHDGSAEEAGVAERMASYLAACAADKSAG